MNFLQFKEVFFPLVCFTTNQVLAKYTDFSQMNLTHWLKQGYIVRLRRGWFSFPEFGKNPDFVRLAANKIYKPSYISLQYALAFYGMIPETVVQLTCVASLKTASFENGWGQFVYQNLKPSLFFGYAPYPIEHPSANGQYFLMATPEKALLDFLYLNPFYKTQDDFEALRLDEDFMTDSLDRERMDAYLRKFANKALDKRVASLLRLYD